MVKLDGQAEIKKLIARFGIHTQPCAQYVAENYSLDEMREMLGPTDALEMAWPGGVPGRGGNMNQLPKEVALKVRKQALKAMSAEERYRAMMFA